MNGIGTVELPTDLRSPNLTGTDAHGTLRLTNVLHAPKIICNILGGPVLDDHSLLLGRHDNPTSKGFLKDCQDRYVAYFDANRPLYVVKLRGPPVGPHVIKPDANYMINVWWDDAERVSWEQDHPNLPSFAGEYTPGEKKWLKDNYRSEFHFLRDFGLSIYKDEDRDEGRQIVQSLMAQDEE